MSKVFILLHYDEAGYRTIIGVFDSEPLALEVQKEKESAPYFDAELDSFIVSEYSIVRTNSKTTFEHYMRDSDFKKE